MIYAAMGIVNEVQLITLKLIKTGPIINLTGSLTTLSRRPSTAGRRLELCLGGSAAESRRAGGSAANEANHFTGNAALKILPLRARPAAAQPCERPRTLATRAASVV